MSGQEQAVLYDVLGPRGRRRTAWATWLVGALLAGLVVVVLLRLRDRGQLEWALWAPLLDPTDQEFSQLWTYLGGGLVATLAAAALAVVLAVPLGTALACWRVTAGALSRWGVAGVIELLRGVPVVVAIFFAGRVLPELGADLPAVWYVVIGLVVYNSVVIAEILRAGIAALPRGQREAAAAIGLSTGQTLRLVLLPQAFRIMLPALISQLVVIVKDTSLGFIVQYQELLRRANIAIQTTENPIQTLTVVAIIYIAINYALGRLAEVAERRVARGRRPRSGSSTLALPEPSVVTSA